ncbi:hypothetical protein PoB_001364000 [Plakobranchus ocellatus]|uniref:Uncharacterized protein n=1 Tax=Plakobranchus ocellatus TaxID=259542 RepID=A0AAV3YW50_9GAST|nr:hypothetical protein PoB_001364000 [Plakobranchus ocellatus]
MEGPCGFHRASQAKPHHAASTLDVNLLGKEGFKRPSDHDVCDGLQLGATTEESSQISGWVPKQLQYQSPSRFYERAQTLVTSLWQSLWKMIQVTNATFIDTRHLVFLCCIACLHTKSVPCCRLNTVDYANCRDSVSARLSVQEPGQWYTE